MLHFRETGEEYLEDVIDEEVSATDQTGTYKTVGGKSRQDAENITAGKNTNYTGICKIMFISIIFVKKMDMSVENFRSRRWKSSLTVCARLTVGSSPHQQERKFSGAHVCRVTFKHLPKPLRSHTRSFRTLGQLLKIPPFVRPNIA